MRLIFAALIPAYVLMAIAVLATWTLWDDDPDAVQPAATARATLAARQITATEAEASALRELRGDGSEWIDRGYEPFCDAEERSSGYTTGWLVVCGMVNTCNAATLGCPASGVAERVEQLVTYLVRDNGTILQR
jgi:hypothetical protein